MAGEAVAIRLASQSAQVGFSAIAATVRNFLDRATKNIDGAPTKTVLYLHKRQRRHTDVGEKRFEEAVLADVATLDRDQLARGVARLMDGRKLPWLEEKTGIEKGRLWRILGNKRLEPTADELLRIASALERSVEDLLAAGTEPEGQE